MFKCTHDCQLGEPWFSNSPVQHHRPLAVREHHLQLPEDPVLRGVVHGGVVGAAAEAGGEEEEADAAALADAIEAEVVLNWEIIIMKYASYFSIIFFLCRRLFHYIA